MTQENKDLIKWSLVVLPITIISIVIIVSNALALDNVLMIASLLVILTTVVTAMYYLIKIMGTFKSYENIYSAFIAFVLVLPPLALLSLISNLDKQILANLLVLIVSAYGIGSLVIMGIKLKKNPEETRHTYREFGTRLMATIITIPAVFVIINTDWDKELGTLEWSLIIMMVVSVGIASMFNTDDEWRDDL